MQREAYEQLFKVEDTHWYFYSRNKLVEFYLGRIKNELNCDLEILDIGSGTGIMFKLLEKYGRVTGLEISEFAARLCRRKYPESPVIVNSADNIADIFPSASFDLITFFNVLYHQWIRDDAYVLRQAAKILRPGGYIFLVEPAHKFLYRNNDRFCYGLRRYSYNDISALLFKSGLNLLESTYFNSISLIPLSMAVFLERIGLKTLKGVTNELRRLPRVINNCLIGMMMLERLCIINFGKIPFGLSLLFIGRKAK